ncbi:MAG: OsmC family protein [Bacteroidales bacterium]|nr:OsmC family protein [Bacteroidales bacterium]
MAGKDNVTAKWLGNMAFEGKVGNHKIIIDAGKNGGGEDRGTRPKALMLLALAGCTGIDVVSILAKMRVEVENLDIRVEGDLTEEYPKYYHSIHVIYEFTGKGLPLDKLQKAVSLSEDKYCGVSAVYKKVIKMTSEIKIIESLP